MAGTGDVVGIRARAGNAHTGRGAARFLTEVFNRVRGAGAGGKLTLRADSGFCSRATVGACERSGVEYSITVKSSKGLRSAYEAIEEDDWSPIPYWLEGGADVAEISYLPFGRRRGEGVRLIVRRVKPTPGSQLALLAPYSYHAFITDRMGEMLELEADHTPRSATKAAMAGGQKPVPSVRKSPDERGWRLNPLRGFTGSRPTSGQ